MATNAGKPPKPSTPAGTKPATGKAKPPAGSGGGGSSASSNVPFWTQPMFDQRIYTITMPMGSDIGGKLQHGYMKWNKVIPGYSQRAVVHFLYNPTTIATSYSIASNDVSYAQIFRNAADKAQSHVPLTQSTSFSLLYDRTYELWGSYSPAGTPLDETQTPINNPSASGVGVDILAMKQFTGMLANQPGGQGNSAVGKTSTTTAKGKTTQPGPLTQALTADYSQQGVMVPIPAWVYFASGTGIYYYGWVTDWDVTVTHWTQYMIPMRCVINVDFALLPPPANTPTAGVADSWWSLIGVGAYVPPPTLPPTPGGKSGRS